MSSLARLSVQERAVSQTQSGRVSQIKCHPSIGVAVQPTRHLLGETKAHPRLCLRTGIAHNPWPQSPKREKGIRRVCFCSTRDIELRSLSSSDQCVYV